MAMTSLMTLHSAQTAPLFGRGTAAPIWRLRLKSPPLRGRYLGALFTAISRRTTRERTPGNVR
jgi:hypothetical protein